MKCNFGESCSLGQLSPLHMYFPLSATYVVCVEVMHQQTMVVTDCHLQQLRAFPQPSRIQR